MRSNRGADEIALTPPPDTSRSAIRDPVAYPEGILRRNQRGRKNRPPSPHRTPTTPRAFTGALSKISIKAI